MAIKNLRLFFFLATLVCGTLLPVAAYAAWVSVAEDIFYDDSSAATNGYGAPIKLGETLVFTPSGIIFEIDDGEGDGGPWATSLLVTESSGGPSRVGRTVSFVERGDFSISSAATLVFNPRIFVYSIENPSTEFEIFDFEFIVSADGPTMLGDWRFAGSFVLPEIANGGFLMTLQNNVTLADGSLEDLDGFIQKKFIGVTVPVPAAFWLMFTALGSTLVGRVLRTP